MSAAAFLVAWLTGMESASPSVHPVRRSLLLACSVLLLGLGLGWLTLPPDPPPLVPHHATTSPPVTR